MLAVENPARPFGIGCRFFAISISSQANFADTILIKSNTDEPTAPIDGWPYGWLWMAMDGMHGWPHGWHDGPMDGMNRKCPRVYPRDRYLHARAKTQEAGNPRGPPAYGGHPPMGPMGATQRLGPGAASAPAPPSYIFTAFLFVSTPLQNENAATSASHSKKKRPSADHLSSERTEMTTKHYRRYPL